MTNTAEVQMKPLTRRERKYLQPAIVYGWEIHLWPGRKDGAWDADSILPVKVGKMAESLIARGYLERIERVIRPTKKALALKCRRGDCSHGRLYDENDMEAGRCPECEDGILPEASNE
ncbi:hypothetical protein MUA03_08125 [Enterobacteriaceae bacterium H16N7]|nr:hypothetical protein [Dryocola clanedunensis]